MKKKRNQTYRQYERGENEAPKMMKWKYQEANMYGMKIMYNES